MLNDNNVWIQDNLHADKPFSPAAQVIQGDYMSEGFHLAFKDYQLPYEVRVKFVNHYMYLNIPPLQAHLHDDQHETIYHQSVMSFADNWYNTWKEELLSHHQHFDSYQCDTSDMANFIREFSSLLGRVKSLWHIHGLIFLPMFIAPSLLLRFAKKMQLPRYLVLDASLSLDNISLSMGKDLFDIANAIRENHAITKRLLSTESNVLATYDVTALFNPLLTEKINQFFTNYGKRSHEYSELMSPTWLEDKTVFFQLLKNALTAECPQVKQLSKNREKSTNDLIAIIKKRAPEQLAFLNKLVDAARLANKLQEDHHYAIEQRIIYEVRRFYLATSRYLTQQGFTHHQKNIFMLKPQQLIDILNGKTVFDGTLVKKISNELTNAKETPPKPLLSPTKNLKAPIANSLNLAIDDFFGTSPPKPPKDNRLIGRGAGNKTVRGRAKLILDLDQGFTLNKGDILVTHATSPAWTPLFGIAGGLVTACGGISSHAAIVAREYGLPAVVGVANALEHIKSGSMIEINAETGMVTLL